MSYQTDWAAVLPQLPQLAKGLLFTLKISLVSYLLALVIGLVVALLRISGNRLLAGFAFTYTQFFRAISIYIYIIWIYFGLATVTGINLSPFAASVIAITLLHSAYLSEIYRSAIGYVPDGQWEASRSLGMSRRATFFDVVMPQAMTLALPQMVSQFAMILKDSAVVALIGASDLMYEAIRGANLGFRTFEFYTVAAVFYVVIVLAVSGLGKLLENHLRRGI